MKNLLIALPLLVCSPSCKAVDGLLGVNASGEADKSEEVISGVEGAVRPVADILLPGVGGAIVLALGQLARAYVKKRKAAAQPA